MSEPSAFPSVIYDADDLGEINRGMSLRDWFAGKALVAIVSKLPLIDQTGEFGISVPDKTKLNEDIAGSCYAYADAMLKARDAK